MDYLDLTPTFNCVFSSQITGTTYKFSLLWSDVNGWLISISKRVDGQYAAMIEGRALRLDENFFDGLGEPILITPRYEEPTLDNIGITCFLEVEYVV